MPATDGAGLGAPVVQRGSSLFGTVELVKLARVAGRWQWPIPSSTTGIYVEVGANNRDTLDEELLPRRPRAFLITLEPLLTSYASLRHAQLNLAPVDGCSSLLQKNSGASWGHFCIETNEVRHVPTISLHRVELLKVDAQGYDLQVAVLEVTLETPGCTGLYLNMSKCTDVVRSMKQMGLLPYRAEVHWVPPWRQSHWDEDDCQQTQPYDPRLQARGAHPPLKSTGTGVSAADGARGAAALSDAGLRLWRRGRWDPRRCTGAAGVGTRGGAPAPRALGPAAVHRRRGRWDPRRCTGAARVGTRGGAPAPRVCPPRRWWGVTAGASARYTVSDHGGGALWFAEEGPGGEIRGELRPAVFQPAAGDADPPVTAYCSRAASAGTGVSAADGARGAAALSDAGYTVSDHGGGALWFAEEGPGGEIRGELRPASGGPPSGCGDPSGEVAANTWEGVWAVDARPVPGTVLGTIWLRHDRTMRSVFQPVDGDADPPTAVSGARTGTALADYTCFEWRVRVGRADPQHHDVHPWMDDYES
eukprot:gene8823-58670_t